MLWSNVETLAPALYARPPKALAARRYLDRDPIGRIACRVIQRAVQYQIDLGELHEAMKQVVLDRLLGGRGQVWCRYEPTIEGGANGDDDLDEPGSGPDPDNAQAGDDPADGGDDGREPDAESDQGRVSREVVHVDYVNRKDFRHDPARTWPEVNWVARRVFMTRAELVKRFGSLGRQVNLNYGPDGAEDKARERGTVEALRKAEVWEIWDKTKRETVWLAKGTESLLDRREDPYKLEDFFPCPKPLYSSLTNDSLIPTPDYAQYKPQALQMDVIAGRIEALTEAMKVAGAYDSAAPRIASILKADENTLIPIDRWAEFAQQGGGLKGSIDFLPLDMFAKALDQLMKVSDKVKADIYETTGISDILRGQGDPDETATGVQTKGHFASLRLEARQMEVARFSRDVIRIMAEITCELFQPETLAEMSSAEEMDELQIPMPPPPPSGLLGMSGMPPQGASPVPSGMPAGGAPIPPQHLPMMAGAPT